MIEKLRLDGNKSFKEGRYQEALDAYSSAINLGRDCNNAFNPLLLTNLATVYIKLKQYEMLLKMRTGSRVVQIAGEAMLEMLWHSMA